MHTKFNKLLFLSLFLSFFSPHIVYICFLCILFLTRNFCLKNFFLSLEVYHINALCVLWHISEVKFTHDIFAILSMCIKTRLSHKTQILFIDNLNISLELLSNSIFIFCMQNCFKPVFFCICARIKFNPITLCTPSTNVAVVADGLKKYTHFRINSSNKK